MPRKGTRRKENEGEREREREESRSSGKVARCTILRDPTTTLSRLRRFSHGVYMRGTLPRSVDGNGPTAGGWWNKSPRPYISAEISARRESFVSISSRIVLLQPGITSSQIFSHFKVSASFVSDTVHCPPKVLGCLFSMNCNFFFFYPVKVSNICELYGIILSKLNTLSC